MLPSRRLLCLLAVLLSCLSLRAQTNYTSVVVFGDSLSDTGNIAHLTQSMYLVRYPADNQLLGFNYTDGRFTDGKDTQPAARAYFGVWAEQLAASFAAKPTIKNSLDGGTNYAYGDATTGSGTTTVTDTFAGQTVSVTLENMGQQVTDYLATNPTPNAQTLFILWGGANDLFASPTQTAATTAVQNELALVQRLMAVGASNFLIPNLPPLGGTATDPTSTALNTASGTFAAALTQGIATLKMAAAAQSTPLTIYQPDIFTLFATVAQAPMAVGLSNITTPAQGISGSPDTYLFWDTVHPTTAGHHYIAAAASNLLTPLVASSVKLTVPAAAVAGQTVTLTAVASSTASTSKPTGGVTFFNGTSVLTSAALDATGTATAQLTVASASSPYAITAVYAGDTTFNPSNSGTPQPLTVISTPVATSTTVSSSSLNANLGSSVTFTATVTPSVSTYGTPAGTVTFLDGSTSLGTGTLSGTGTATLTTSTLTAGTHTITATYTAAGLFAGSTSTAISEVITAPSFTATASPNPLTITHGASGTSTITVTPVGGYSGTLTFACGTLPTAHLSCAFSSSTLTFTSASSSTQTTTLTIATNAASAQEIPARPGAFTSARIVSALLFGPGLGTLLLAGIRRRKTGTRTPRLLLLLLLLSAGSIFGITGCSNSNNSSTGTTTTTTAAVGTYTVPVTVTPSGGSATSVSLQVVIQ